MEFVNGSFISLDFPVVLGIIFYEEDISTKQKKKKKDPWFQGTDENEIRQKSFKPKKEKRSETSGRLKSALCKTRGRFGIDKKNIICNRSEIKDLFSNGKRLKFNDLVIIYKPDICSKVSFFASGKLKGAVKRNRVKRILREAYRMNKEIFMGFKVIFYAKGLLDATEILNAFQVFKKECVNGRK